MQNLNPNVIDEAMSVFNFYHSTAAPMLAITVAETDEFPEAVLLEIRAAFTHLCKVLCEPSSTEVQDLEECRKARGHLTRVCLDATKLVLLDIFEEFVELRERASKAFLFANSDSSAIDDLFERRTKLAVDENKIPVTEELLEHYLQLQVDARELLGKLRLDYQNPENNKRVRALETRNSELEAEILAIRKGVRWGSLHTWAAAVVGALIGVVLASVANS